MSKLEVGVAIREATASDHVVCAEILTRAWRSALPTRPRRVDLGEFRRQTLGELLLVAVVADEVVAFISIWQPDWFVHHLFVDPAFQHQGIGSSLLEHLARLSGDHALSLKCQVENHAAIGFYERHGFRRTELRGRDEFGEWVELERAGWHSSDTP